MRGLVYSSDVSSVLTKWATNSWIHVTGWHPGGICDREHIAGGSRGLGFYDVRSPLDSTNERPKLTWAPTSIFSSWRESTRLIRLSAYLTVTHFIFNLIVLGGLLVAVASIAPCMPQMPCSKLIIPKPAWEVLPATILFAQLCEPDDRLVRLGCTDRVVLIADLCLIVFSYFVHLENHSRRAYVPEVSSRSLTTPASHRLDHKRLLSTSESHPPVELGAVESGTATRSLPVDGSEAGYGGGMRTYEEAEKNEKARLRLEMESEDHQAVSFPVPSTSEAGILTPLGLEWRDGDLPPYAS